MTAAIAVAATLLLARSAAGATVMVTTPTGVAGGDAGAIEKRVKEALKKNGHKIATTTVSLEDSAAALGCAASEASCVASIASVAGADFIVAPRAEMMESGRLKIVLALYRGDGLSVGDTELSVERASAPGDYAAALAPLLGVRTTTTTTATPATSGGSSFADPGPDPAPGTSGESGGSGRGAPGKILPLTWGIAGGGVVALGVGIGLAAWAASLQARLNREPLLDDESRRAARLLFSKMRAASGSAGAFIGIGSLLVLAGGFLVADNLWLGIVFKGADGADLALSLSGSF